MNAWGDRFLGFLGGSQISIFGTLQKIKCLAHGNFWGGPKLACEAHGRLA